HDRDNPGAEIEFPPVAVGALRAGLDSVDDVVIRLPRVGKGVMEPIGDLARDLERAWPLHASHLQWDSVLHWARCGEQARVLEEVSLEIDLAVVEEGPHHVHRLA